MILERPQTETSDSGHTKITGYTTVARPWCAIEPLRGQEMILARQVNAETTHRIRTRYCGSFDIKTYDRLMWGDRVFEIESVINVDERNREWEINAVERKADR